MSTRRVSFEVAQVYEHLWTSTCDSVFGAPKVCAEPTQKKTRSKSGPLLRRTNTNEFWVRPIGEQGHLIEGKEK